MQNLSQEEIALERETETGILVLQFGRGVRYLRMRHLAGYLQQSLRGQGDGPAAEACTAEVKVVG
jgi:hypothetical protein